MSEDKVISPVHTSCKSCAYAEYDDLTQVGCHLKIIDSLIKNEIEILDAYDEEKEFYVINNKYCIGYTTDEHLSKRSLNTLNEKIEYFHKNNYLKYCLFIDLKKFTTQDSLNNLVSLLADIKIKPTHMVFIRWKDICTELHSYENIQKILNQANIIDTIWRIQTMLDTEISEPDLIYQTIISTDHRFLCIITDIPYGIDKLITYCNDLVHKNMSYFTIISNSEKSCTIFPISTYKYYLYTLKQDLLLQDSLYTII